MPPEATEQSQRPVPVPDRDWEDIGRDREGNLWIADTGGLDFGPEPDDGVLAIGSGGSYALAAARAAPRAARGSPTAAGVRLTPPMGLTSWAAFTRAGAFKLDNQSRVVTSEGIPMEPAITIPEDTRITDAARQMQRGNIRRLLVVDGRGRIAGIVSRRDLLQVFLRTDEDLRDEVVARILRSVVPGDAEGLDVEVLANVITLSGEVDRRTDAEILGRLARDLDGVVDVVNRLTFRWDDLKPRAHAI